MLLDVRDVTVSVASRVLLEGVSFSLPASKVAALVAPSGAGKTTLLRSIAGLHPCTGEIRLEGRTMDELGPPAFRRRLVYVAQKPAMLDGTVDENLSRPFGYRTAGAPYPREMAIELLKQLDLPSVLEEPAPRLSVGEQQRVALVRALLLRPGVLLLDEPTSALDAANAKRVEEMLRQMVASSALAILAVTHQPAQIERFADEVIDLEPYRSAAA